MSEAGASVLIDRVTRLEREMRWWKCATLTVLLVGLGAILTGLGSSQDKVLEVHRLVVKDPDGKIRIVLGDWGQYISAPLPSDLRYQDVNQLFSWERHPWGLHIFSPSGRQLGRLSSFPLSGTEDSGTLFLTDEKTVSEATLSVMNSYADLRLKASRLTPEQDRKEQEAFAKKINSAKSDQERMQAFSLRTPAEREAMLILTDRQANFNLWENGTSRLLLGQTVLRDQHDVETHRPLSSIVLFDKEGKVLRTFP